jgi:aspartyl-tRNA(Asn)/glutamyl-tRNA(Gln) amidotransferase subunit B
VVQETRLFDPGTGTTRSMRSKEDAHDYRYFPDPDLLPLELDDAFLEECRASLPELPDAKRNRYETGELGLSAYNARVLTAEVETARWFEALLAATAAAQGKPEADVAKQVANWLLSERRASMKALGDEADLANSHGRGAGRRSSSCRIAGHDQRRHIAKEVFEIVLEDRPRPTRSPRREGLKQTSDTGAIEAAVDKVLAANADKVEQYKGGKEALFGFFVGQTMKAMQGKANPQVVQLVLSCAEAIGP